ncbi:dynein light chain Tctex-type 3 isoform X1 [Vanacampus margaritifer]
MEEFNNGDEAIFNADEATNNIKECIEGVIGGMDYSQSKVNQWSASIVEQSLTHLVKQGRPFKYIVNCTVMQKSGAGLHTANSCYWDNATDGEIIHHIGSCTVRWENRTMYCVVSVFAVAM